MQISDILKKTTFLIVIMMCCSGTLWGETVIERVEKLRRTESKIDLYGKIIDQDDRPVVGATVNYEIARYGILRPYYNRGETVSAKDGNFEVHADKGGLLYIKNIDCKGYEYKISYAPGRTNVTSLEFRSSYRDRHRADKDNPIIWHLRRKDHKGSCLLKTSIEIKLSMEQRDGRDGREYGRDFAQEMAYWLSGFSRDTKEGPYVGDVFWDIEATGEADREKGVWNVVIRANGEKAGIQRLDTLLYAAPADGYGRELELTIPFGKQKHSPLPGDSALSILNFYARLRNPGIYARLDVERIFADESRLVIYCHVFINPYGDRSLEELVSLEEKLSYRDYNNATSEKRAMIDKSGHLIGEARLSAEKAMREQRLAERPPFEEWIKEGLAFW